MRLNHQFEASLPTAPDSLVCKNTTHLSILDLLFFFLESAACNEHIRECVSTYKATRQCAIEYAQLAAIGSNNNKNDNNNGCCSKGHPG